MGLKIGDAGYRIIAPIASGGMGEVYKAEHVITRRIEAIKVLSGAGTDEESERFLREIRLQASLSHPNIAAVYNAFSVDDNLVMVMELVEGESLAGLLGRAPLSLPRALHYACQALDAIAYAHAHGVIHRDISPANIIITNTGNVKLMDFGLAKAQTSPTLSNSGASMGSPGYMSPEQVRDSNQASPRSDIYGLGAVLYEMVTARRPFDGDSAFSIMQAQVEQAPVPPIEIDTTVPPALNAAILTALEKDPERRHASAEAFRLALEDVIAEIDPVEEPAPRPRRRGLQFFVPALAAVCALTLAASWLAIARRSAAANRIPPPVVQIHAPAPPPIAIQIPPAAVEPPPAPRSPRLSPPRQAKAERPLHRDPSPRVTGGQRPAASSRVILEPARRAETTIAAAPSGERTMTPLPEASNPEAAEELAAPSPAGATAEPAAASDKEKKPRGKFRRVIDRIFSPFH